MIFKFYTGICHNLSLLLRNKSKQFIFSRELKQYDFFCRYWEYLFEIRKKQDILDWEWGLISVHGDGMIML